MSEGNMSCIHCGGLWSRPGKFGCDLPGHPSPTLSQRIALAIESDLNDRRGYHLSVLDNETNRKILDCWAELIEAELKRSNVICP